MIATLAAGFVLGALGSVPIAGTVSVFVCRRGLAGYLRQGLALAVGAALAEGAWCLLVLIGAGGILARWPTVTVVARVAGGMLLLVLGVVLVARRVPVLVPGAGAPPVGRRLRDEFRLGATLAGANLAIPVNWLALSTLAVSFGLQPHQRPAAFAAGVSLGIVTWFAALLRLLGSVRHRVDPAILDRLPRWLGGLLLAGGVFTLARVWL